MSEQNSTVSVYDVTEMAEDPAPTRPISPRTIVSVLGPNPDVDALTLRALVDGLLATIKKREFEHELQQNNAATQVEALERHLEHHEESHSQPPEGFLKNNGRLPCFNIPCGVGLYRPAKWIQQRDDGTVAGYTDRDGPSDNPHITEVYAIPDYGTNTNPEPLPHWVSKVLVAEGAKFHMFREAVAELDDWGLLADVQRHRSITDRLHDVRFRLDALSWESDSLINQRDLCEFRLEGARLAERVPDGRRLLRRTTEPTVDAMNQVAKRGKKFRGRGRPF
jgi:hypothetical protein